MSSSRPGCRLGRDAGHAAVSHDAGLQRGVGTVDEGGSDFGGRAVGRHAAEGQMAGVVKTVDVERPGDVEAACGKRHVDAVRPVNAAIEGHGEGVIRGGAGAAVSLRSETEGQFGVQVLTGAGILDVGILGIPVGNDVAGDGGPGKDIDGLDEGVFRNVDGGRAAVQAAAHVEGRDQRPVEVEGQTAVIEVAVGDGLLPSIRRPDP